MTSSPPAEYLDPCNNEDAVSWSDDDDDDAAHSPSKDLSQGLTGVAEPLGPMLLDQAPTTTMQPDDGAGQCPSKDLCYGSTPPTEPLGPMLPETSATTGVQPDTEVDTNDCAPLEEDDEGDNDDDSPGSRAARSDETPSEEDAEGEQDDDYLLSLTGQGDLGDMDEDEDYLPPLSGQGEMDDMDEDDEMEYDMDCDEKEDEDGGKVDALSEHSESDCMADEHANEGHGTADEDKDSTMDERQSQDAGDDKRGNTEEDEGGESLANDPRGKGSRKSERQVKSRVQIGALAGMQGTDSWKKPVKSKAKLEVAKEGEELLDSLALAERLQGGDSLAGAIDVDALFDAVPLEWEPPEITLKLDKQEKHTHIRDLVAYGPTIADKRVYHPRFHHKITHTKLHTIFNVLEMGYVDGLPRHIFDPKSSVFHIMTHQDFETLKPREVQDIMRYKHIVLTGCPISNIKFDAEGLSTVASLHDIIAIQDGSVIRNQSMKKRVPFGTLQQLLEAALDPDGKILNALDNPSWDEPTTVNSYSIDLAAWKATRMNFAGDKVEYPRGDMRWKLASTADTLTAIHMDSDGMATEVEVIGEKLWIVGHSKPGCSFSDISLLVDKRFQLDEAPAGGYFGFEAIVLSPGTCIKMRPNTLHQVYGPMPTISRGSHFINSATMQDTNFGVIHTFICHDFITNTSHHPTRMLFRRIAEFYWGGLVQEKFVSNGKLIFHLKTFESVLDLLCLCNLVILGNVLDERTYLGPNQQAEARTHPVAERRMTEHDANTLDRCERLRMVQARGMCFYLLDWFEECYEIRNTETNAVVRAVPYSFLAKQGAAIVKYKKNAWNRATINGGRIHGTPHCTPLRLESQMDNVMQVHPKVFLAWQNRTEFDTTSLSYGSKGSSYTVLRTKAHASQKGATLAMFEEAGSTENDKTYTTLRKRRDQMDVNFEVIDTSIVREAAVKKRRTE
ncbi:hypothetical protein GALMADRAFT_148754 [Galerina marginata CBS 339.88]|uniref:JmjC domain-containing protein n=1 Tax=Galerina marginata (strain CBS 339.88) TaxID=685588 RepID=A0A067SF20_GALM3|nr:hypothetical protein GALMADRAFT_148754 [Galerina marginata CBS 339.88]